MSYKYRPPTSTRTAQRHLTHRRHLDLTPTVSAYALAAHHTERAFTLGRQRYQTGPRFGQELAAERKLLAGVREWERGVR